VSTKPVFLKFNFLGGGGEVTARQIRLVCAANRFRLLVQDFGSADWFYLAENKVHFWGVVNAKTTRLNKLR